MTAILKDASVRLRDKPFRADPGNIDPAGIACDLLENDPLLVALNAMAPHATECALEMLDDALLALERLDLFDHRGRLVERPRLFGRIVKCIFAAVDGRCVVEVTSTVKRRKGLDAPAHIVLIGGVRLTDCDNETPELAEPMQDANKYIDSNRFAVGFQSVRDDDTADGNPYYDCDCHAFAFKHAHEPYCKHIIAACIAIALNLASVKVVSDEELIHIARPSR